MGAIWIAGAVRWGRWTATWSRGRVTPGGFNLHGEVLVLRQLRRVRRQELNHALVGRNGHAKVVANVIGPCEAGFATQRFYEGVVLNQRPLALQEALQNGQVLVLLVRFRLPGLGRRSRQLVRQVAHVDRPTGRDACRDREHGRWSRVDTRGAGKGGRKGWDLLCRVRRTAWLVWLLRRVPRVDILTPVPTVLTIHPRP